MGTVQTEKLKSLALAATPGPWTFEVEDYTPNYVRAGRALIAQVIGDSAECDLTAEFIAAANPATVLELIADHDKTLLERDELRAEVEHLRAVEAINTADAARWKRWLPWMRQLNKLPFDLAKEICKIDAAIEKEGA